MITRLLVDELHLPADILDQWTEFELSQFLIHINCAVFGPSSSSLLYNDTPLAGAVNSVFTICKNTTVLRFLCALITPIIPFAETAALK